MKKQGRRWIGAILAMLMLVVSLYTDTSVTANAATKKASVSFANLPEGNTLKLEDTYKYDFNAKKTGTAKVVYFEVKNGTNTAGVQSSNSGIVYPVTAGQFDVRVVAFASTANRTKWLDARKKNGYVADPSAEKKYVVAASDWETITVTSETEGLGVARNQSALNKVLKNKKVTNVLIWTDAERIFEIGSKNYKSKTLTVNAPQSEITNSGRFAQINVEQIKPATFREKAKGNKFVITAINARVIVEKGARILELIYKPVVKVATDVVTTSSFNFKLEIQGTVNTVNVAPQKAEGVTEAIAPVVEIETAENSNISEVKVEESTDLKLTGEKETAVKVTVEENAVNTKLTAEVPVKADLSANTTVTLAEDAKNSEITLSKKVDVEVKAADAEKAVEDVTINVAKEAEGASLKTEVKAEIKAEANVSITLDKTAQDSTVIVTDENVKVEVEKTDEDGNVSKEEITSTPIPAPDTTTPPSTGGNVQAPDPKPEAPTIAKISYTVSGSAATEVTLTNNAGTVSTEMKVGQTVTFAAPEGYKITVGASLTFEKAGQQDANITLVKTDDSTVTVTVKVTFTNVTTTTVTPPGNTPIIAKISYTVSGSDSVSDVTLTSNAGTVSTEMKVGQTVTFTAPEGYKITAGASLTFEEAGQQDASITLAKTDDSTVTVTVKVTFSKITAVTGGNEGQKPELSVIVSVNPASIQGSTVATQAAIKASETTGAAVTATARTTDSGKTITVAVPEGTYTGSFTLTANAQVANVEGATFKYQWYKDNGSISDATGKTYLISLADAPTDKAGKYYVVVEYTDTNTNTIWTCSSKDGTVTQK